ncbi:hypothetical protein CNEO4_510037 [Clostridium neonatale]|uniref:Uncharacterized protein n=1 Tax=Clostridium neonatale TaxID=137838 RepID=A0AA86JSV6_9CLOT|nr:hypothetical protein CNEO_45011 [Clostridium neonatale]CAI3671295.1 hypothetical protein CNEO4_510037 [Clostridium neonatale]CAI4140946.1 hypothetical protein CNEO4_540107 [Clostridium neonatale]
MQGTFINLRPMFLEYEFISALSLEVRVCASTDIKIALFLSTSFATYDKNVLSTPLEKATAHEPYEARRFFNFFSFSSIDNILVITAYYNT